MTKRWNGIRLACAILILLSSLSAGHGGLTIHSRYSPKNRSRPRRTRTDYIILHTTEGPSKGSLKKVWENGETHYFVDPAGVVYRIIDKSRVALHAGRSMWNGRTNVDLFSIGIEVVGYHDRSLTTKQVAALRQLLGDLQKIYRIPDERVLTHSMVAYGAPNRWHPRSHRGRKRCGMLFATCSVRAKLGLERTPTYDPDVKAGRLVVGDPQLAKVLYSAGVGEQAAAVKIAESGGNVIAAGRSAWDIARDRYRSSDVTYVFPDGRKLKGNEIHDWTRIPVGTQVLDSGDSSDNAEERVYEIGVDGDTAWDIAGDEYGDHSTIYVLPDCRVRRGNELTKQELDRIARGTRVLVGYTYGGRITATRSAFDICGDRWSVAATFYLLPDGSIQPGNRVNERSIPAGTQLFFRN